VDHWLQMRHFWPGNVFLWKDKLCAPHYGSVYRLPSSTTYMPESTLVWSQSRDFFGFRTNVKPRAQAVKNKVLMSNVKHSNRDHQAVVGGFAVKLTRGQRQTPRSWNKQCQCLSDITAFLLNRDYEQEDLVLRAPHFPQTAQLQGHENDFEAHTESRIVQALDTRPCFDVHTHTLDTSNICIILHYCYANSGPRNNNVVLALYTNTCLPTTLAPAYIHAT